MTESSILSTQRQPFIISQEMQKSNMQINHATLKELMIVSNQILTKWKQQTPNIEKSLQDLKHLVSFINRITNKLYHTHNDNLLLKYKPKDYQRYTSSSHQANRNTSVNNIAHNLHYKNTHQADQGMQTPYKKINRLAQTVHNNITTPGTQSKSKSAMQSDASISQHSLSFRSSVNNIPVKNNLDVKLQLQNPILGAHTTADVVPSIIDLLMVSQLGRINTYDKQLLNSYELIQARNDLLNQTQTILSLARSQKPTGNATAKMPQDVIDFMQTQGLAFPASTADLKADQFDGYIESINNLLSQYNSESQLELIKLQRVISYRNQAFEIVSNTLSRIIRTRDTIISNIR